MTRIASRGRDAIFLSVESQRIDDASITDQDAVCLRSRAVACATIEHDLIAGEMLAVCAGQISGSGFTLPEDLRGIEAVRLQPGGDDRFVIRRIDSV